MFSFGMISFLDPTYTFDFRYQMGFGVIGVASLNMLVNIAVVAVMTIIKLV